MRFTKAHAYGNDFIYLRKRELAASHSESVSALDTLDALAREWCNRHSGIGADGLIVYEPARSGASMRLFNADGSRSEVSGNGVRALGALLLVLLPVAAR